MKRKAIDIFGRKYTEKELILALGILNDTQARVVLCKKVNENKIQVEVKTELGTCKCLLTKDRENVINTFDSISKGYVFAFKDVFSENPFPYDATNCQTIQTIKDEEVVGYGINQYQKTLSANLENKIINKEFSENESVRKMQELICKSGLTATEFSIKYEIPISTMYSWLRENETRAEYPIYIYNLLSMAVDIDNGDM